jgi:hypothetical protein
VTVPKPTVQEIVQGLTMMGVRHEIEQRAYSRDPLGCPIRLRVEEGRAYGGWGEGKSEFCSKKAFLMSLASAVAECELRVERERRETERRAAIVAAVAEAKAKRAAEATA